MAHTLVFVNRTVGCPLSTLAHRILEDYAVLYVERYYDTDAGVKARLIEATGFLSVPTLYMADASDLDTPVTPPEPLESGASPRGIDRGSMLTEPSADQLLAWLQKHALVSQDSSVAG